MAPVSLAYGMLSVAPIPGGERRAMLARRLALLTAGAVLVVGGAACGGSDEGAVREAVQAYTTAAEEGDVEALCEVGAEAVGARDEEQCVNVLGPLYSTPRPEGSGPEFGEVAEIQIDGDTATAELPINGEPGTFSLHEQDGDWKIEELSGAGVIQVFGDGR